MAEIFGTDGVRGLADELGGVLTYRLGKAVVHELIETAGSKRPKILVGRDTRISGPMLTAALASGIMAVGGDVIDVGVIPTPAVAYLVRHMGADAGAVITASHNPFQYNGIKFFNADGFKLDDDIEESIEKMVVFSENLPKAEADAVGQFANKHGEAVQLYSAFLASILADQTLSRRAPAAKRKIVFDCANGAASQVVPGLVQMLKLNAEVLFAEPSGTNINEKCGSTHLEALTSAVVSQKADIGLAFDGDADRLLCVDENGVVRDGDELLYLFAKGGRSKAIAGTVMSNMGLKLALETLGVTFEETAVGDRYVLERMLEKNLTIGGEQSGHIIFLNGQNTTGDGIYAALQVLKILFGSDKKFSELFSDITILPQILVNAKLADTHRRAFEKDHEIKGEIARINEQLAGRGRILVRLSGTEPVGRVMVEGSDEKEIEKLARGLAKMITEKYGE